MTTTELVPIQETVSLPITVEEATQQWAEYQRLTHQLLDTSDYQKIGQRSFKKKSAWRKYARAFNIADRVTFEHIERAEDGFPLWARIRVEASHPNGRSAEADHECHVKERCCVAATGTPCEKKSWRGHTCCAVGCNGRIHWSHPGDLPATALTRAKNRAISDLIGAGEVSAEEMSDERERVVEGEVTRRSVARQAPPPRPANVDQDGVIENKITQATANAIAEAYHRVREARGNDEFKGSIRPEMQTLWPQAFLASSNRLAALSEAEGFDVLAFLHDMMPEPADEPGPALPLDG